MSIVSSPSPRLRPKSQADDTQLPQGHCRYILLVPELKGQRCGCAHFNLNRAMPGATCECGHLACYHVSNSQPPTVSGSHDIVVLEQRLQLLEKEHVELHQLRRDFMLLQEQLNQDCFRNQELVERVSELEDATEKSKLDVDQQVREAYRNLKRAWDSINELSHHNMATDNQIHRINENLRAVNAEIPQFGERQVELDAEVARISQRQLELSDINIALEERIESLEPLDGLEERVVTLEALENQRQIDDRTVSRGIEQRPSSSPALTAERALLPPSLRPRPVDGSRLVASRSNSNSLSSPLSDKAASNRMQMAHRVESAQDALSVASLLGNSYHHPECRTPPLTSAPAHPVSVSQRPSSVGSNYESTELWTVHISLMPAATLPMPFERGTNAYKRCLSRGLHQMVPVNGTDAEAIERAVRKAFKGFLGDHPWIPLKAEPCTADGLTGLPMLRQLDPSLVDKPYDFQFLMDNCAVRDRNGHIDSLYIAMRDRTISWYKLRKAPVFLEGLETSWSFDVMLDNKNDPVASSGDGGDSSEDENKGGVPRPPAGDIAACLSLKRAASEMSRSSSFGSATTQMPTTAEGEGSRSKMPRIHPLPNLVEVRRGVTTL